jgi:hypothetical protein
MPSNTFKSLPIDSLGTRVLCKRHNTAMSGLDSQMIRFSETMQLYDDALRDDTGEPAEVAVFAGEDLERWMLKAALGGVESDNLGGTLKIECLDILFGRQPWPTTWGLYFEGHLGATFHHSDSFILETLWDEATQRILAVRFVVRGFPFCLLLGVPDDPSKVGAHRPGTIVFARGKRERRAVLTWTARPQAPSVRMERTGSYDGAPPTWEDWAREG